MLIVDSQVHIWSPNTPERPWVPGHKPQLPEPFGADRLLALMLDAGVSAAILVPPVLEADRNDFCRAAAQAQPDRFCRRASNSERGQGGLVIFALGLIAEVGEIAQAHPGLNVILDHMGFSEAMKGTSLSVARSAPAVRRVVERFGRERCFWGADVTRLKIARE